MFEGAKRALDITDTLYLRGLKSRDLPDVLAIEEKVYAFPWSEAIFKDCLFVGYSNWALVKNKQVIGYAILSIAVEEAHILNVCIAPEWQGKGYATQFLKELSSIAIEGQAKHIFLEVRPSNTVAVKLYAKLGFNEIGRRKAYYPLKEGREDALVLSLQLLK